MNNINLSDVFVSENQNVNKITNIKNHLLFRMVRHYICSTLSNKLKHFNK